MTIKTRVVRRETAATREVHNPVHPAILNQVHQAIQKKDLHRWMKMSKEKFPAKVEKLQLKRERVMMIPVQIKTVIAVVRAVVTQALKAVIVADKAAEIPAVHKAE